MRLSPAFLLKFFGCAAVLFAAWSFAGIGDLYGRFIAAVAAPFLRVVLDCQMTEVRTTFRGLDIVLERQGYEMVMPLQPREAFSGIVPFLSLMLASGGMALAARAGKIAVGIAAFFIFHLLMMFIGAFLTGLPQGTLDPSTIRNVVNPLVDVVYAYVGLIGFAALPFLLWFWLTPRGAVVPHEPDS